MNTVLKTEILASIKNDEIQNTILKDLIKDKNRKIRLLMIINIVISVLLFASMFFSICYIKKSMCYSSATDTIIREASELVELNISTPQRNDSKFTRGMNVSGNKKDK